MWFFRWALMTDVSRQSGRCVAGAGRQHLDHHAGSMKASCRPTRRRRPPQDLARRRARLSVRGTSRLDPSRLDLPAAAGDTDTVRLSQRLLDGLRRATSRRRAASSTAPTRPVCPWSAGDAVIAPAMAHLGHDWEAGRIDVMHEHRGTLLCTAVLHELRPALERERREGPPRRGRGQPEGDHSLPGQFAHSDVPTPAGCDQPRSAHAPASFRVALGELNPAWSGCP